MKLLYFILVLTIFLKLSSQQRKYTLYLDDAKILCNLEYCTANTTLHGLMLSAYVNSLKVIKKIWVTVKLTANRDRNAVVIFDQTIRTCSIDDIIKMLPLLKPLLADLNKTTTIPWTCPIPQGIYSVRNFTISTNYLPAYVPDISFKYELGLKKPAEFDDTVRLFDFVLTGRVRNNIKQG